MSAPDYETLYNVEPAVEAAFKHVLTAQVTATFTQRESENLPPCRIDAQLQLGAELVQRQFDKQGRPMACAWNATLGLAINTPRFVPASTPAGIIQQDDPVPFDPTAHALYRARIRHLIQIPLNTFDPAVLPYHVVTKIMGASTRPQVIADEDQDVSEMFFNCVVSIRTNAWPEV